MVGGKTGLALIDPLDSSGQKSFLKPFRHEGDYFSLLAVFALNRLALYPVFDDSKSIDRAHVSIDNPAQKEKVDNYLYLPSPGKRADELKTNHN